MPEKSTFAFAGAFLTLCFLLVLHKPLPPDFCGEKSIIDRIVLHLFEPVLRAVYYLPSHYLLSNPYHQVWWTRNSLELLSKTMGPFKMFDQSIVSKDDTWQGVKVRWYQPVSNSTSTDNYDANGAIIFIHGGGFAIGSVEMYDGLTWRIAKQLNTFVVSIDYRLSPETVFPENLLECEKAVNFLFENSRKFRINPEKIVIIGDSAGGNLATVIAQRRVLSQRKPDIAAQILIYPLLQLVDLQLLSYRFYHKRLDGFAFVDPKAVAFYYMLYAGIAVEKAKELVPVVMSNGHVRDEQMVFVEKKLPNRSKLETNYPYNHTKIPPRWPISQSSEAQKLLEPFLFDPDFSPIMRDNLEKLPKSLVITCQYDTLRDEGILYAEKLKAAGVPTTHINYRNGFHAMLNVHNEITEASECVEDVLRWIRDNVFDKK